MQQSHGYRAVFSLGELSPRFGGAGTPEIVAYRQDGVGLGADGFARLVILGGRFGFNLAGLEVVDAAPGRAALPGGPSESCTLSGAVRDPTTFKLADLQALPMSTRTVTSWPAARRSPRRTPGPAFGNWWSPRTSSLTRRSAMTS